MRARYQKKAYCHWCQQDHDATVSPDGYRAVAYCPTTGCRYDVEGPQAQYDRLLRDEPHAHVDAWRRAQHKTELARAEEHRRRAVIEGRRRQIRRLKQERDRALSELYWTRLQYESLATDYGS